MNNKGRASIVAILSLVLAIGYAIAILILANDKNTAFWVVFGSTIFVLLSQFVFYIKLNAEGDKILFASPGMNLGLIFIFIEAYINYKLIELQMAIYAANSANDSINEVINSIEFIDFMDTTEIENQINQTMYDTTYRYITAAQIGVIVVYIVWAVIVMRGQIVAKSIDDKLSHSADLTKGWERKINLVCLELKGTEYEAKAKALYEEIKYCKPQNTGDYNDFDIQIMDAIEEIQLVVASANRDDLNASIDKCITLVKKRNIA